MMKHIKKRNKKAIELPVSMIVVLILSIVVFAFGITMVFKFFQEAQNRTSEIDSETERQIMNAMREGNDVVALSKKSITTKPGIKTTIGVGITNILDPSDFAVCTTLDESYTQDDKLMQDIDKDEIQTKWLGSFKKQKITIEKDKFVAVPLTINAASSNKGTYVFNVCAFKMCPPNNSGSPTNCVQQEPECIREQDCTLGNKDATYDKKIHQLSVKII